MYIKQNISDALQNKGETRKEFKKELQEFCEKVIPNIKTLELFHSENNRDMKKLEQDYLNYISKNNEDKDELLRLVMELPPLDSLVLLGALVKKSEKINDALHSNDNLFNELDKRSEKLRKEEQKNKKNIIFTPQPHMLYFRKELDLLSNDFHAINSLSRTKDIELSKDSVVLEKFKEFISKCNDLHDELEQKLR
ncbi:hypothetical protein [Bacillus cereus group sp. TH152-1LC]|uniref:hypothetical protein n=1 Tax=Bacillus cereus group sp. TH152-1LC TaxID=3018060 RepID=UPI0022DFBC64|nr:hypothetical protein [Bacillus cereus group sp. TH152-1LC]MDA1675189.1 hypothetical protein [Bacillus cereus group sp. TH152-1LC]